MACEGLKIFSEYVMKWTKAKDYEEMSRFAAKRIYGIISGKLEAGESVNMGAATGNTMIRLYGILADMLNDSGLDLGRFSTFNLDEYVVGDGKNIPPEHPLSYRKYMTENFYELLDPALGFRPENMLFPDSGDPAAYDEKINASGDLDFQLLGIGFNGHIAFNEPQSADEISAEDFTKLPSRIIDLDSLTIQTNARLTAGNDLDKVPRKAVTMGMASILNAKEIMLLACFSEQAAPLREIKAGKVSPENPGSFLLLHPNAEIVYSAEDLNENFD